MNAVDTNVLIYAQDPREPDKQNIDERYNQGYTCDMKTAISIPDNLFEEAEETAQRLGISRSELYARAVKAFLATLRQDDITERLNTVYADEPSELDDVVAKMQSASIPEEPW